MSSMIDGHNQPESFKYEEYYYNRSDKSSVKNDDDQLTDKENNDFGKRQAGALSGCKRNSSRI